MSELTPQLELTTARERIDEIDLLLANLLAERLKIASQIGEVKRSQGLPVYNGERERAVISRFVDQASDGGVDPKMAMGIITNIVGACRNLQISTRRDAEQIVRSESVF